MSIIEVNIYGGIKNMTISEIVTSISASNIITEQEVRTKVAIPILECLGYPIENRAEEFPIFGFEGRTALPAKSVDIMMFADSDFQKYRNKTQRHWVMDNSLVAVELKKPGVTINSSLGQAQFYAMWSRACYYIVTNGEEIEIYKLSNFCGDKCICSCNIVELPSKWIEVFSEISFEHVMQLKNDRKYNHKSHNDMLYLEYCLSQILAIEDNSVWKWDRTFEKGSIWNQNGDLQLKKRLPLQSIIENDDKIVILAPSGSGKTVCMNSIIQDYTKKYIDKIQNNIPVILYAKFWNKTYHSIEQGILNELAPFVSGITEEVIKAEMESGKYILLIDGLDECIIDRDTLTNAIQKISKYKNFKIVTSCRPERYHDELNSFSVYSLNLLNEQEILNISTEILGYNTNRLIYSMDRGLKELIKIPMFFSMVLSSCACSNKHELPKNKAILYSNFINYVLTEYIAKKGVYDVDLINIDVIKNILSKFAYDSLVNINKNMRLADIILSISNDSQYIKEINNILIKSGIMISKNGTVDFYHYSIKEYFFALHISNFSDEKIIEFLDKNSRCEEYQDIIFFLMGNISCDTSQNILLNHLEKKNLKLYIKCLKVRYNFSNTFENNLTKDICFNFFKQILKSYDTIVDTHFLKCKEHFYPWAGINPYNERNKYHSTIKGCINPDDFSVHVSISCCDTEATIERVQVEFSDSKPSVTMNKEGKTIQIPMFSFTDNKNHYYYNIKSIYFGIDCAREIAIQIIKSNLLRIIKERMLLFEESPAMMCDYIEENIRKIPSQILKDTIKVDVKRLSLKEKTIYEMINLFAPVNNLTFEMRMGYRIERISFFLIWYVLTLIDKTGVDAKRTLIPDIDLINEVGKSQSAWVWELYSTDCIKRWISSFYNEFQNSYRNIVDKCFCTLKNDLPLYSVGPIQYEVKIYDDLNTKIEKDCYVDVSWEPKNSLDECSTIISSQKEEQKYNINDNVRDDKCYKLHRKLALMGRKNCGYFWKQSRLVSGYLLVETTIRNEVYKQLESDFETILGK